MNCIQLKITSFVFLIFSLCFSQFESFDVKLDLRNIRENDKMLFQNFSNQVNDFFLVNIFGENIDFLSIQATLHLIIESIVDYNNQKTINAQAILTNRNDFIITLKSISFPSNQLKSISYNPNDYKSLNSFLEYIACILIGNELDTYELNGGNTYFNQASKIASQGRESIYPSGWESRWKKTKEIQENHYLRNTKYYYFNAFDIQYENEAVFEKNIKLMHESIKRNKEFVGIDNNTKNFLRAYKSKIVEFYKFLNMKEELFFLQNYDIDNKKLYQKAIEELN